MGEINTILDSLIYLAYYSPALSIPSGAVLMIVDELNEGYKRIHHLLPDWTWKNYARAEIIRKEMEINLEKIIDGN